MGFILKYGMSLNFQNLDSCPSTIYLLNNPFFFQTDSSGSFTIGIWVDSWIALFPHLSSCPSASSFQMAAEDLPWIAESRGSTLSLDS